MRLVQVVPAAAPHELRYAGEHWASVGTRLPPAVGHALSTLEGEAGSRVARWRLGIDP